MKRYGTKKKTAQAAIMLLVCPGFEHGILRLVYHPKTGKLMHCVPLADNSTYACMKRVVPKEELDVMREHTGSSGEPLWYDVAG